MSPTSFQPLVLEQLKAIGVTLVLAIVGTTVIAYVVKALVGLRPSEEVEIAGLTSPTTARKDTQNKPKKTRRCAGCWQNPTPAQQ